MSRAKMSPVGVRDPYPLCKTGWYPAATGIVAALRYWLSTILREITFPRDAIRHR